MFKITADQARRYAQSGNYFGSGKSERRIKSLHEIADSRTITDKHRWDDRSCRHYDGPPNRSTVDLYDRILQHG